VNIHFATSTRGRFTLQRSEDLRTWTDVADTAEIDSVGDVQDSAALANARFYRLMRTQ